MTIKYYIDSEGNYLGGFDGALPPEGSVEVPSPPQHALNETWVNGAWVEKPTTLAAKLDEYEVALDEHINGIVRNLADASGKPYRFTNIVSAVSYAWRTDSSRRNVAQALADWQDAFWDAADAVYLAVNNGDRPFPSVKDLIAELPVFTFTE